jgi:hypothetical protein
MGAAKSSMERIPWEDLGISLLILIGLSYLGEIQIPKSIKHFLSLK